MAVELTATTESRAATARMSAHETVCGHKASTRALMSSMTPKPLIDATFGRAPCSPVKVAVSLSSTDASHPCCSHTYKVTSNSIEIDSVKERKIHYILLLVADLQ
jgi:hypothetical protein